jgi:hypothetical protein
MTRHTLFGSTTPANVQNSDSASVNLATSFHITAGTAWTATGVRFWLDATSATPELTGYVAYLSSGDDGRTLTLLASKAFGMVAKGQWNELLWDAPVALTVGVNYWVTVYFPHGCYSNTPHMFDSAVQATDGSALWAPASANILPGNGEFAYASPGDMATASAFNANWYGIDVITDDGVPDGAAPPSHAAIAAALGRPRWNAALRAPRWASTILQPRWKAAIMGPTTLPAATGPEYLPLTVTRNGPGSAVPWSAGCSYSIVAGVTTTPGAWTACTVVDGSPCATISGLTPGTYTVFLQIAASPETIVRNLGQITLT